MSCSSCSNSDCSCPRQGSVDVNNPLNLVTTGEDVALDNFVDQVHIVITAGDPDPVTITLPQAPRIGQTVRVVACQGSATVTGGDCNDICGGDVTVPECFQNEFTFSACCQWVPINRPSID